MRESDATEQRIAGMASRQGGVVGIAQLLDAGLSHNGVARRVAAGRLHLNTDRERDVTLALAGRRTLRFTHDQVTTRPGYVTGAITTALGG